MSEEVRKPEMREAHTSLYQSDGKAIAIINVEGRRVVGVGDSVSAALTDAFGTAFPEMKGVRIDAGALMQMPRVEDLEQLPDGFFTAD